MAGHATRQPPSAGAARAHGCLQCCWRLHAQLPPSAKPPTMLLARVLGGSPRLGAGWPCCWLPGVLNGVDLSCSAGDCA
eukprot:1771134-Lingulodinium_polyedra.AAC.1